MFGSPSFASLFSPTSPCLLATWVSSIQWRDRGVLMFWSTSLCVPSFAIFCYVFLCRLRGPAWGVGGYRIGQPAGRISQNTYNKISWMRECATLYFSLWIILGQVREEGVGVVKAKYQKEAISRLLAAEASNFLRRWGAAALAAEQSGAGNTSWIL